MNKKLYSIIGLEDNKIYKYYACSIKDTIEKHRYYLALKEGNIEDYVVEEHNKHFSIEYDNKTYCIKK